MTKFLFAVLPMLLVSWFYACPTTAQDVTLPGFRQIAEVQRNCPHGSRCFLAGPGATASQMLAQVNRGIADATRRVTMTDLETANPCDVSYVRDDGSARRNGLCPVMNGTTERVTWESFCDGHHACQRWIIASYPGRLRQYNVPTRHHAVSEVRIEARAPLPDESPPAVTAVPVPVVAATPPSGASANVPAATPSPDLSLQRRIAQLTQERDAARRAATAKGSGVDWALSGLMIGIVLVLLLVAFYLGSLRSKVTTVNLSEDEIRGWNHKLQTAEQYAKAESDALKGKLEATERKLQEELGKADADIAPFRVLQALYKSKMNQELTPVHLDGTIKGSKAHAILESALSGLSVNAVKQAVQDSGLYRNLKAAWSDAFPGVELNTRAVLGVPLAHKQAIEALCATHNAEIEELKKAPSAPAEDDKVNELLMRLSNELWKPLLELTRGDFGSLLSLDEHGHRVVDPNKVKNKFGSNGEFTQRGRRGGRSGDLNLLQLTSFFRGIHDQFTQVAKALDDIIAGPPDCDLASLFDDKDDEPTGEIVLDRDASGANALPADPTRVTDTGEKPEPET